MLNSTETLLSKQSQVMCKAEKNTPTGTDCLSKNDHDQSQNPDVKISDLPSECNQRWKKTQLPHLPL